LAGGGVSFGLGFDAAGLLSFGGVTLAGFGAESAIISSFA
jgi:hypothetical protein